MKEEINYLQKLLSDGFHKDVFLVEKRPNLFQVFTPFTHPDGDMVDIYLSMEGKDTVKVQDMGMTLMKLSYDFDLETKTKRKVFNEVLTNYQISEQNNNLYVIANKENLFPYVMQLIQVIVKVSDINFLKREVVKSLFYEYFDKFIFDKFGQYFPLKDWYPSFDKEKLYPSPYAITQDEKRAICLFPIGSDKKCNEAIITVQHYESHDFKPETIAVFENQESIGRKPLARLSNVVGKQFASLAGNEDRIVDTMSKYRSQLGFA